MIWHHLIQPVDAMNKISKQNEILCDSHILFICDCRKSSGTIVKSCLCSTFNAIVFILQFKFEIFDKKFIIFKRLYFDLMQGNKKMRDRCVF